MTRNMAEILEGWRTGRIAPPPVTELIGIDLVDYSEGSATMVLETDRRHHNPMGIVHGGILCDLADAAMGVSVATTLEAGETFVSIDLNARYFVPVQESRLEAVGKVVRRGKKIIYVECVIRDFEGRLVAKTSSSCLIQPK